MILFPQYFSSVAVFLLCHRVMGRHLFFLPSFFLLYSKYVFDDMEMFSSLCMGMPQGPDSSTGSQRGSLARLVSGRELQWGPPCPNETQTVRVALASRDAPQRRCESCQKRFPRLEKKGKDRSGNQIVSSQSTRLHVDTLRVIGWLFDSFCYSVPSYPFTENAKQPLVT